MLMSKFLQGILRAKDDDNSGGGDADKDNDKGNSDDSDDEGNEDSDESDEDESGDEDEEGEEGKDDKTVTGLTKEQRKEADNLYRLIANPETQKQTLEILAKQAGIALGKEAPQTKEESKEAAESLVEILEKSLGTELKWLAPKLATALEKIREQDRGETKKELDVLKQSQIEKEVDQAYESLARETKGLSRKFEGKMVSLADKLLPAPGMSTAEYIRHLYTIASASTSAVSNKQKLAEKINRNSKDVPGRLGNSTSSGGGKGRDSDVRLSVKEAVRQAAAKMGYKGE